MNRWWPIALLFVAVMPDTLPYPGLDVVIKERFGLSDSSSQLFAVASLCGALLALPLLRRVRHLPTGRLILVAGVAQAVVVGAMALPVSWSLMLVLRGVQGGFDLFTLAVLTGAATRMLGGTGRTFGIIGSTIMAGLACGLGLGGVLAAFSPTSVFIVGGVVALVMGVSGLVLDGVTATRKTPARVHMTRSLVQGIACAGSDRFLAGMTTVILPLLLADTLGLDLRLIGMVMGLPLLMAVFGGVGAGMAVDRFGALRVRAIGCVAYGLGLALLVSGGGTMISLVLATALMGLGITSILPTSLVLATRFDGTASDSAVIGRVQMGGQLGYFVGGLTAFGLTALFGGATSGVVLIGAAAYLVWNVGWLRFGGTSSEVSIDVEDRSTLDGFIHRDHKRRRPAVTRSSTYRRTSEPTRTGSR